MRLVCRFGGASNAEGVEMKFKTFVLCKLQRRHQWKFIRLYNNFEAMCECKRCGMVWVKGVGVIDLGH